MLAVPFPLFTFSLDDCDECLYDEESEGSG